MNERKDLYSGQRRESEEIENIKKNCLRESEQTTLHALVFKDQLGHF